MSYVNNSTKYLKKNPISQITIYTFWTYFHSVMIQTYFDLVAIIMWS